VVGDPTKQMTRNIFVLSIILIVCDFSDANTCCLKKIVNTGTGDPRDGSYTYNSTSTTLPVFCGDECVYTKDDSNINDLYCFGTGDIDSTCSEPGATDPPAPEGAPDAGGNRDDEEWVPSGEYYHNKMPGSVTRAVQCGETISIVTEDRLSKLDLASMSSLVAADFSAWSSTKIRFDRIDGPSSGDVQFDHLVGIFANNDEGVMFRLKVSGSTSMSTTTSTTKLGVRSGDGSSCTGSVQYGVEYGVFTEDMNNRLDIGETGAGTLTPWDEHTSSTRFHLDPAIA